MTARQVTSGRARLAAPPPPGGSPWRPGGRRPRPGWWPSPSGGRAGDRRAGAGSQCTDTGDPDNTTTQLFLVLHSGIIKGSDGHVYYLKLASNRLMSGRVKGGKTYINSFFLNWISRDVSYGMDWKYRDLPASRTPSLAAAGRSRKHH